MIATIRTLALATALAAIPIAAGAQQATLKVVSFVPKSASYSVSFQKMFDAANTDPMNEFARLQVLSAMKAAQPRP